MQQQATEREIVSSKQSDASHLSQKRKSDSEMIEEYWDRFKTETPVENLISGQGTFQI